MNSKKPAYGGHGESPYCCFHPREVVVGVCAHCLKDRLLLLLAGDAQHRRGRARSGSISLPKQVFALGSSFLQRLDSSRHHRPAAADSDDGTAASGSAASLDDSFISIKFEDNGKATWDSNKQQQQPVATVRSSSSSAVVVVAAAEHGKRGGVTRWRKQVVGRLLQLARWKRSAAAGERSVNSKARPARGWIRTLTRRHRP
ncbi:unnamed protein product [Urochloa decumbens]|uniref:Uncharacterized protein n=1 Tax=Urochloa decumbens TaxID=240449 RepID=A0ABC9GY93_9POAL